MLLEKGLKVSFKMPGLPRLNGTIEGFGHDVCEDKATIIITLNRAYLQVPGYPAPSNFKDDIKTKGDENDG